MQIKLLLQYYYYYYYYYYHHHYYHYYYYRMSHAGFRLIPKSVTLNDLGGVMTADRRCLCDS